MASRFLPALQLAGAQVLNATWSFLCRGYAIIALLSKPWKKWSDFCLWNLLNSLILNFPALHIGFHSTSHLCFSSHSFALSFARSGFLLPFFWNALKAIEDSTHSPPSLALISFLTGAPVHPEDFSPFAQLETKPNLHLKVKWNTSQFTFRCILNSSRWYISVDVYI